MGETKIIGTVEITKAELDEAVSYLYDKFINEGIPKSEIKKHITESSISEYWIARGKQDYSKAMEILKQFNVS